MDTLLKLAQKDETIGNALVLERYTDEEFLAKYTVNSDTLAALVGQFSEGTASAVKDAIDGAVRIGEDTYFSVIYNAKTQDVSQVGIHGTVTPILQEEGKETQSLFRSVSLSADMKVFTDKAEGFEIPPLEDYQEFVLPTSEEAQD